MCILVSVRIYMFLFCLVYALLCIASNVCSPLPQLVTHGDTREEALATMAKALDHYCIQGSCIIFKFVLPIYTL